MDKPRMSWVPIRNGLILSLVLWGLIVYVGFAVYRYLRS